MIYLITGVPGSGKTLYAVSTLVQKLAAEKLTGPDGVERPRRVVVDGIPDLVMDHELMAPRRDESAPTGRRGAKSGDADVEQVGHGLWNWFEWCQPGDVLVVDEVQRYWRPRGMGTAPPLEIAQLETHRHLGVDFVIITQNPMLIDQNVRRLVGRHQHIRRLFGMARAVIYDWDGCSVDVHRTKSATTSMWAYPKSAYRLYKSAELHTKQKQKIPAWLAVPLLAVAGGIAIAPTAYGTLSGAVSGKGVTRESSKSSSVPVPAVAVTDSSVTVLPPVLGPAKLPEALLEPSSGIAVAIAPAVEVAGCVAVADRCACFDSVGKKVEADLSLCSDLFRASKPVPINLEHLAAYSLPNKGPELAHDFPDGR